MYVFFDCETSDGPPPRGTLPSNIKAWPRLVQLGWVACDNSGRESAAEEAIVQPSGFTIAEGAAAVHGISTERAMREGALLKPTLTAFTSVLNAADVWVAHNVAFDKPVLEAEYARTGLPQPRVPYRYVCTMQGSTHYCKLPGNYGQYKWPKLSELHHVLFGEPFQGAHGALADARACMRCYFRLAELGVAL